MGLLSRYPSGRRFQSQWLSLLLIYLQLWLLHLCWHFVVVYGKRHHHTKIAKVASFSSQIKLLQQQRKTLRVILGFSSGYVGTSTFSNRETYNATDLLKRNVALLFENGGSAPAKGCLSPHWNITNEIEHVEYFYGPDVLLRNANFNVSNVSTVVDFSHSNICFYRGLFTVLQLNKIRFHVIRIIRERFETVMSMTLESNKNADALKNDHYRFHPFDQPKNVVLRVPRGVSTWHHFSHNQRAFWVIDETQARWDTMLQSARTISHSEVYWSNSNADLAEAIAHTAKLIGVRVAEGFSYTVMIDTVNATNNVALIETLQEEDRIYRQMMMFKPTNYMNVSVGEASYEIFTLL